MICERCGSPCEFSDIDDFAGGSVRYQCTVLVFSAHNSSKFDFFMGLVRSLLDRLGMIEKEFGHVACSKLADSIDALVDEELKVDEEMLSGSRTSSKIRFRFEYPQ